MNLDNAERIATHDPVALNIASLNDPVQTTNFPSGMSFDQQLADYHSKKKQQHIEMMANSNPPDLVQITEASPNKVDVLFIGDSMIKNIQPSKMSRWINVKCKSFPGAKIQDVSESVYNLSKDNAPKEVILHLGSNNLHSDDEVQIVTKISSLCEEIVTKTEVSAITLSSIIHRHPETQSQRKKVDAINVQLKLLTNERGWKLVDNSAIYPDIYLQADGLHLNGSGVIELAKNIIRHLRQNSSQLVDHHFPDYRRTNHQRKAKDRIFPRDWMDSLNTARRLLNPSS